MIICDTHIWLILYGLFSCFAGCNFMLCVVPVLLFCIVLSELLEQPKQLKECSPETVLGIFSDQLPPANEVWGKVIFSEASVKNSVHRGVGGGVWSGGCLLGGGVGLVWGVWSWGCVPGPGGGGWWRPPDGYCCGRYASYWNAFLFIGMFSRSAQCMINTG